jgi:hypothetical protein
MLGLFVAAHLQLVIMLAELKKGLHLKRKCLCSKTTTVILECTVAKTHDMNLLDFNAP